MGHALVSEAFSGRVRAPEAWQISRLVFLKKHFVAIALECVFQVVHYGLGQFACTRKKSRLWVSLFHVGRREVCTCEQGSLTNLVQKHLGVAGKTTQGSGQRDLNMFAREELSLRVMEDEKRGLCQGNRASSSRPLQTAHIQSHKLTSGTACTCFPPKTKGSLPHPTPCSCQSLRSSRPLNWMTFPHSCERLSSDVVTLHFLPQSPLVTLLEYQSKCAQQRQGTSESATCWRKFTSYTQRVQSQP